MERKIMTPAELNKELDNLLADIVFSKKIKVSKNIVA